MSTKKYLFIFGGIILVAVILYFFLSKPATTEQVSIKVKKGQFPIEVTTTGELIAKHSEKIYGPEGLRQIQIWQVKIQDIIPDGTVVDSGQYVATLDRTEISNKIKDEETNLEKLESQLTKTRLDTSLELRSARDELVNLHYNMEQKKIELEQSKYEPPATVRQVQIDLEKGERALQQSEENYKLRLKKAIANMVEVTASYTQARRKLEQLRSVLDDFTVKAPKSGMVIYKRNWDGNKQGVGATVNAWDNVVAELPDLSEMISKTYVNEIDISKVKTGQKVNIGIDAFPEKKFTGTVTEVANIGEQLQSTNAKVFEVKILVNEFDSILRPAMTTKNTIVTAVIDSVIFIPIEGIFNNDTITFIYKKNGSRIAKQQVVVGRSNDNEIIVREGLAEDDEILLVPPDNADKMELTALDPEVLKKYETKKEPAPKVKDTATVDTTKATIPGIGVKSGSGKGEGDKVFNRRGASDKKNDRSK